MAKFQRWVNFVREVELEVVWVPRTPTTSLTIGDTPRTQDPHAMANYYPLDADQREIRLLDIHPGRPGDPLVCSLVYVSIAGPNNSVPYTALSYCWGARKDKRPLTLHFPPKIAQGTTIAPSLRTSIQANLYDALSHLRSEQGLCRRVWADALCINQKDVSERSRQVLLMRDIYICAEHVCVWLGEGDVDTENMLRKLNTFVRAYVEDKSGFPHRTTKDITAPHGIEHFGSDNYHALSEIFNFDWYTRVWVIQEVFNAKLTTVQIGSVSLSWPLILRIGSCLEKATEKARMMGLLTMPSVFLSLFNVHVDAKGITTSPRYIKDLLALLMISLDLDATDPRDKVFALMQFWENADLESLPDEIRPDYSKNTEQVFADFTRWWIREHQSLRILSTVHTSVHRTWQRVAIETSPNLPNDRPTWAMWHSGSSTWAQGTLAYDPNCPYAASGTLHSERRLLQQPEKNGTVLSLEGIHIGYVSQIGLFPWIRTFTGRHRDLAQAFEDIFDPAGVRGTWTPSGFTSNVSGPDQKGQLLDHLVAHEEFLLSHNGAVPCISPCLLFGKDLSDDRLRGLCPYMARKGDLIVVLVGGKVPYLIRESSECDSNVGQEARYSFVGECYVEGYMDGRAVTAWRDGKLEMKVFNLV